MNEEALHALSDGTFRSRWLRELLRTARVTESVKMILVSMAFEEMDPSGRVSVPRELLSARIGRSKARVSERLNEAVSEGFLVRLSAGKKGSTAVYAAALNGSACADPIEGATSPSLGPPIRTESNHFGSDLQDAEPEEKGPPIRTRTIFGSDLQDALGGETVRIGGPKEAIKGPRSRDAKVVRGTGEKFVVPPDTRDEEFLMVGAAAAPPAKKRPARARGARIPMPQDFAINSSMRGWAGEHCPLVDVDLETQVFKNYWLDRPRIKRPGWGRSWESWMLRQQAWMQERAKSQRDNVRSLRPTGTAGHQTYQNPSDPNVYFEDL